MTGMVTRPVLVALLLAAFPVTAFMQAGPTFEVAAINPVQLPDAQAMAAALQSGQLRIGMVVTGSRAEFGFLSLADLLPRAYRVQPYQIVSAPSWAAEQRFNIRATLPAGSTKDQVPDMLRALLEQRFGLVAHREQREMDVYALVVGKDGPKLAAAEELPPLGDPGPGEFALDTGESQFRMTVDPGGMSAIGTTESTGPMRMKIDPAASPMRLQMEYLAVSMRMLADQLTQMADRPVLDRTGLKGTYKATLEMSLGDLLQVAQTMGFGMPGNPAGGPGGLPAAAASAPSGNSLAQTVRKLGLELTPQRAPVDVIVIDKLEREPTPN